MSASDRLTPSPSDAVTATVEPRPLQLAFTNTTVPYAGWAAFVERGRDADFTRILEATLIDGGFIVGAVDHMPNRRVGPGEGLLIPPPHSLCTAYEADDETTAVGRYVRANVTVVVPPDERSAAAARGDGVATRVWIVFRGFTDAARVGIFGRDPDGAVEASVPRDSRDAKLAFTQHCFARSATPIGGPVAVTLQPPPPTPIAAVESAKGVAKAATQAVAVAGAVVSGATIAAQVSRTAFALGMVQCQPDPDQLDWPQNPFGRSVGPGDAGIWAGAALFNPIFLGLIGVVLAGAGYVLSVVDDMSLQSAFAIVRFPSLLSFFLLLVTDATIQAAVISIIFGEGHHKALGIIVLLVGLATVGFVSSKLYSGFGGTLVRNADPLTGWRRVLFGTDRWLDTVSITATQRFEAMQGRYDAVKGNCVLRLALKGYLGEFEALQERLRLAEEQPTPGGAAEGERNRDGLDDLLLPAKVDIGPGGGDDDDAEGPHKQSDEERKEALYALVLPTATTARGFCKRNKMFFDEYNDRIPHFFAFEFAVVFATGILEGFKLGSGKCEFVALTFFMMMLGYLVVILITQPNVSRYDFGFAVGGTTIQLGSAACFLVGWWSKNAFLFSMSAVLVEAGMYLLILKMILDSAKAVTKFTLLFLNNRRKALQRALLSAEKRKPRRRKKPVAPTPPLEDEAEAEDVPLIEIPPPPPPKPPTPPPPPTSSSSSETEELPPPPPPVRARKPPRRPEVDGLRLAVDNGLRIANRRRSGRSEADVLEAVLKARNAREAHAAIDKAML